MNIFGLHITTKKKYDELKKTIDGFADEVFTLRQEINHRNSLIEKLYKDMEEMIDNRIGELPKLSNNYNLEAIQDTIHFDRITIELTPLFQSIEKDILNLPCKDEVADRIAYNMTKNLEETVRCQVKNELQRIKMEKSCE